MANSIIFYTGAVSASEVVFDFTVSNASLLQNSRILVPEPFWATATDRGVVQNIYRLLHEEDLLSFSHYVERLKHDVLKGGTDDATIFISSNALSDAPYLQLHTDCFKEAFPDFTLKAYYAVTRQDYELESRIRTKLLYGDGVHISPILKDISELTLDYKENLDRLHAAFGAENVRCAPYAPGPEGYRAVLSGLCDVLGLPAEASTKAVRAFSSPFLHADRIPRDVWAFMFTSRLAANKYAYPGKIFPWRSQVAKFVPDSGPGGSRMSFLGPETHAGILARHSASNILAAKILNLPELFPEDTPCEPGWVPWQGIFPDTAHAIAERIDPWLVEHLLKPFAKIPSQYVTRDQQISGRSLANAASPAKNAEKRSHSAPVRAKVAVLTLTYNHAPFIEENIKSVLNQQTDFPVEHIIADDCSTDGTRDIILAYASRYPHIVPVFQKKRNGANNVRTLFESVRSPYTALCDGDDYFCDTGKLQTQADYLDANPGCSICFHPVKVVFEGQPDKSRYYPTPELLPRGPGAFYYISDLVKGNFMQTNSVMYRWRFSAGLPEWFRPGLLPGDWYWHLLHAEKGKIGYLDKVMAIYRRHQQSVYYYAETKPLAHRYRVGLRELRTYHVLNEHFQGKYASVFNDLAGGVIADILNYAAQVDDPEILENISTQFPGFAAHVLAALNFSKKES